MFPGAAVKGYNKIVMAKLVSGTGRFLKSIRQFFRKGLQNLKRLPRKKLLLLIFVLCFVVILICGSLYYFFLRTEKDSSGKSTQTNQSSAESQKGSTEDCEDASGQSQASGGAASNSGQSQSGKKSSGSSSSSGSGQSATQQSGGNSSSNPTPEPDPTPTPETLTANVAFYADSQSDTDAEDLSHQRVVNYILNTSASTVFHAGDLLEDGTQDSLNRFKNVTSAMCSSKAFYAAQGNNERNSSVFFDNFSFPGNEHWYSVNIGNLHMIVLDTYASSTAVGSEQYNWLAADLQSADSQSRATGVIFHYPVYGAGGDYKGLAGSFVPLFRTYGVDFVVSGHEHVYQKAFVDGIYYFVASGQPALGYMRAYVYSTNRVEFYVYDANNNSIDSVNISPR